MATNTGKSYEKITLYFDPDKPDNRRLYQMITENCPKYRRSQYLIDLLAEVFDENEKAKRHRRRKQTASEVMAEEIANALLPKLKGYMISSNEIQEPETEETKEDAKLNKFENSMKQTFGLVDDDLFSDEQGA